MSVHSPSLNIPQQGQLSATLRAATRRIRLLLCVQYGAKALCWSGLLCLLGVLLSKFRLGFAETPEPGVIAAIIGGAILLACIVAWTRRLTTLDVAKLTERRADLKERFSSAVEFQGQGVDANEPFYGEQLDDANRSAANVDLRTLYPLRTSRAFWVGMATTLALLLAYFLPTLPFFQSPKQKQDAADVKKQGIAITKIAQEAKKHADDQKLDETKKAAAEARKLGEAMQKGKLTKKQALVEMQKLTKKMEDAHKKLAANQAKKSMQSAQQQYKKSLDQMQQQIAEAQKRAASQNAMKTNPKEMQKMQNTSEAMKQAQMGLQQMSQAMAQQDPKAMQQAMEKLAQQMQSGQLSKKEMEALQKAMSELSKSLQNTEMQMAADKLASLAQQMQALQQMQKLDPQLLKQLAEMMKQAGQCMGNCKGGQMAQFDNEALKKLIQALKEGRLQMCMGNGMLPGMKGMPSFGKGKGGKGAGLGIGDKGVDKLAKLPTAKPNTRVTGKRSGPSADMQITFTGDAEATKSAIPYYSNVYRASRQQAESALNKESIPATYKKQVRDYFDNIHP